MIARNNAPLASLTPFPRILFTVLLMISCFGLFFLAGIVIALPVFNLNPGDLLTLMGNPDDPRAIPLLEYFQILQSFGLFIVPPLLAGFLFSGNAIAYLKFDSPVSWKTFLAALCIMLVSIPLINILVTWNETITLPSALKSLEDWMKSMEDQANRLTKAFMVMPDFKGLIFNLFLIAVLPAAGEEFLFRGLLQRLFHEWLKNPHLAIVIVAILFSALHLQFYGFIPRFTLGLVLGYMFYYSGSIWIPVFAHFVQNGTVVIVTWLGEHGFISGDYENFGVTSNWLILAGSLSATVALAFIFIKIQRPKSIA